MLRTLSLLSVLFLLVSPALAETALRDTHERLHAVLWVQTSPEYQMACESVFGSAASQLSAALDDPFWTAATEQKGDFSRLPPAAVFDIDETVLDNSPLQARLAAGRVDYDHSMWQKWVAEGQADALPGAAHFVKLLRARGVRPIFLSNRSAQFKQQTFENLKRALDYPDLSPSQVMLKGEKPGWTSDKTSRRKVVCADYRLIFLFGDVYDDFVELGHVSSQERMEKALKHKANWGRRWFLLPNPTYGNWERSLYNFQSAPDQQILNQKYKALKTKQ